jgi:chromosome segregation ATPase
MPEETKTEMVTDKPDEMTGKTEPQASTEMEQTGATELDNVRAALKKANAEAAKYRKAAEQADAERKAKEQAEMTALEKAEARAKELETQLNSERHARLCAEVAAKTGLPAVFADRLKGDTADELEADAKAILELLPKPAAKPQSPGPVTNPGQNGQNGETDEARRKRLGL